MWSVREVAQLLVDPDPWKQVWASRSLEFCGAWDPVVPQLAAAGLKDGLHADWMQGVQPSKHWGRSLDDAGFDALLKVAVDRPADSRLHAAIGAMLLQAPTEMLERRATDFGRVRGVDWIWHNTLKARLELARKEPDALWTEFPDAVKLAQVEDDPDFSRLEQMTLVLSDRAIPAADEIDARLAAIDTSEEVDYLRPYLIEMIGRRRLAQFVPWLVGAIDRKRCDEFVLEALDQALPLLGSQSATEMIAERVVQRGRDKSNQEFNFLSPVASLGQIRELATEELLLALMRNPNLHSDIQSAAAEGLLQLGTIAGTLAVIDFVESDNVSSYFELETELPALCDLHGIAAPKLDQWRRKREKLSDWRTGGRFLLDDDRARPGSQPDSTGEVDEPSDLRSLAAHQESLQPIRNLGPRIGRNDQCPCGSGKKYKKCCGKT